MNSSGITRIQIAIYVAWLLLLIRPGEVPDPWGLGLSLSWTAVCLVAVVLLWLPDLLARAWPTTAFDRTLGVYIAIVGLTWMKSVNSHATLVAALALTANVGLFYATIVLTRRATWLAESIPILLVAAIALLLAMALAFHAEQGLLLRPKLYPVPEGWAGYPQLGMLAAVQFGLLVAGLMSAQRVGALLAIASLIVVNLVELVFLYSRGAWLAIAGVVLVATLLLIQRRQVRRVLLIASLVAGVGGALVASNPTSRYLTQALLLGRVPGAGAPAGVDVATPEMRVHIWTRTLRMIRDSPVYGVGLGNFREVFESKYNPEVGNDGTRGVHAHNLWLQQFAELGVVGGIAYAMLWIQVAWSAWQQARLQPGFLSLALVLSIAAIALSNLTTNMFYLTGGASARLESLTWVLFGLIFTTPRAGSKRPDSFVVGGGRSI